MNIKKLLTDLTASIFNKRGVRGLTKGDNHCSNNSNRNCKHDLISSSSSFLYIKLPNDGAVMGDFSFTLIIRESLSSLSVSSWTSDVTRRVRIAAADIWQKILSNNKNNENKPSPYELTIILVRCHIRISIKASHFQLSFIFNFSKKMKY